MHHCNIVKGIFLYSTATAQSTMDYLPKAIKDGVVDSPPSHAVILVAVDSPSPLQVKETGESSKSKCWDINGAQHNLYLELSPLLNNKLLKVELLYHLLSSSSQLVLPNFHL